MLQALKLCKANNDFTDVLAKCINIIKANFDIVRHVNCEYIVKGKDRCQHCSPCCGGEEGG